MNFARHSDVSCTRARAYLADRNVLAHRLLLPRVRLPRGHTNVLQLLREVAIARFGERILPRPLQIARNRVEFLFRLRTSEEGLITRARQLGSEKEKPRISWQQHF